MVLEVAPAEMVILVEQVLVGIHPAVVVELVAAALECQVELESTQTSLDQH
jgi:flagellar biosynthesis protein FliR